MTITCRQGGKISTDQARDIFMPVLDALKEVHSAGILHRDISPDNLLIDARGRVVLIDFGAARQSMGEKSKSMSVIMKAGYSPEEQYRSRGVQGPWTDIYALAATFYRAVTGEMPPEALDRMAEDTFVPPSQLGVEITEGLEQSLFKAVAVKAKDRHQMVGEFQSGLPKVDTEINLEKDLSRTGAEKSAEEVVEVQKPKGKASVLFSRHNQKAGWRKIRDIGKKIKSYWKDKYAAAVVGLIIILLSVINYLSGGYEAVNSTLLGAGEADTITGPAFIAGLDADYYIDYENGTIPIGDLPIGTKVADLTWQWEFRTGIGYTREEKDETKPVIWIIVSIDHYGRLGPHVTLLSDELIGRYAYDNSSNRGGRRCV